MESWLESRLEVLARILPLMLVYLLRKHYQILAIFCVLRELIFTIRTDWFFVVKINFWDFQKVPSTQH